MEIACEMGGGIKREGPCTYQRGQGQPRSITQLAPASSRHNSQKYAFIMETRS